MWISKLEYEQLQVKALEGQKAKEELETKKRRDAITPYAQGDIVQYYEGVGVISLAEVIQVFLAEESYYKYCYSIQPFDKNKKRETRDHYQLSKVTTAK